MENPGKVNYVQAISTSAIIALAAVMSVVLSCGIMVTVGLVLCLIADIFTITMIKEKASLVLTLVLGVVVSPLLILSYPESIFIGCMVYAVISSALYLCKKQAVISASAILTVNVLALVFSKTKITVLLSATVFSAIAFISAFFVVLRFVTNEETTALDKKYLEINNEALQNSVCRDRLTGLFNKGYYNEEIAKAIAICSHRGKPAVLLMFDLDHFKSVNDTYGHTAGDVALKSFAKVLQKSTRDNDVACRYGGEEFCVIMYCLLEVAAERAEQIRKSVEQLEIDKVGHITVSVGVAEYKNGMDATDWFNAADKMAYEAKKAGRNQVKVLRDVRSVIKVVK